MKRIAVLALLAILSVAGSIPVHAQRIRIAENERQSQEAAKEQQKGETSLHQIRIARRRWSPAA